MSKKSSDPANLALAMVQLSLASWQTIARRSAMIADGTCTPAEYLKMITEKTLAAQQSGLSLMLGQGPAAALRPWSQAARANAKRLRQR